MVLRPMKCFSLDATVKVYSEVCGKAVCGKTARTELMRGKGKAIMLFSFPTLLFKIRG
jgi:hypothetical protein